MNMTQESYNKDRDKDNSGHSFSDISETCYYCQVELTDIKDIFVDMKDQYCCTNCCKYHGVYAKPCMEI